MIKLASITPVKDIKLGLEEPIAMFLTHLVLQHEDYALAAREYEGYKILDNSLIELGSAMSLDKVLLAANIIDADEIVLPDAFQKRKETYELVVKALEELKTKTLPKKYKIMVVAQGSDKDEFYKSFKELAALPGVDVIGVPKIQKERVTYSDLFETTTKEIHFLGCPESLDEIRQMSDYLLTRVRSIDTCIPALNSILTDNPWEKRPTDYTINLHTDRVDVCNYRRIVGGVKKYIRKRKNNNIYIYLAGPLFTSAERKARHEEAHWLRSFGYQVFNPLELNESGVDPSLFFEKDLEAMKKCNVAILTADNFDSGTMVELGWFFAKNKRVITIWSDMRHELIPNLFVRGAASSGKNVILPEFDITRIDKIING